jgi:hypothetical protein
MAMAMSDEEAHSGSGTMSINLGEIVLAGRNSHIHSGQED